MTAPAVRDVGRLADGFAFVEGPRWHDGRLFFSDMVDGRVHSLEPGGEVATVCAVPGRPSGLGFTPAGELLVVSMLDRRLLRLQAGELVVVADLAELVPYPLNDMVVDEQGRAYVGNFGTADGGATLRPTSIVRVDPDGAVAIVAEGLLYPNGMAITPDGRRLIVAETAGLRISAFELGPDGALGEREEWARFSPCPATDLAGVLASSALVPDGICLDLDGALWVGHAKGSGALRLREGGETVDHVPTGDLAVYAVALGGDDGRTLYMCAAPRLGAGDPESEHRSAMLACRVDTAGAGSP